MPGRIDFEMGFKTQTRGALRADDAPMNLLLLGNFSNTENVPNEKDLRVMSIDLDNFDQVMAKLSPSIELNIETEDEQALKIEFTQLEDFHPDALYSNLSVFQHLKDLRKRLSDSATFASAAAELAIEPPQSTTASTSPSSPETADLSEGEVSPFDELIVGRSGNFSTQPTAIDSAYHVDIKSFIQKAIAPHITPGKHPQQDEYVASLDESISQLMRAILHSPKFQALEALWRSAYECVTRLELDEGLKLYLLDISKNDLQKESNTGEADITRCRLYKTLVEQSVTVLGGQRWSVLTGMYSFSYDEKDVQLLKFLSELAYHAGGPFLGAADGAIMGCAAIEKQTSADQWLPLNDDELKHWNELRDSAYATRLGLVSPRMLLRLPYGENNDAIEKFEFEEFSQQDNDIVEDLHHCYLWGNGAVAAMILIGQSFQQNGWDMRLGQALDLGDLPFHIYTVDGEKVMKPCAEALLSERTAQVVINRGIMPLMSYKDRNAVRLYCFQSLSKSNPSLSGPWGA